MLTPMRRFLQILRVFSGALLMLVVFVFFAGLALRIALHGREVAIPDLAGLTVAQASEAALHNGLDLNIENKFYSRTVPAGRILSQAPAAGSRVRRGWQVRVTESLGPQQVTIPDVVGEPVREASLDLRKASLDLGTLAHVDAPGDTDMVLSQTPPPDAGVDQPRVNLLLSQQGSGASDAFVMPSFVGMSWPSANRTAIALACALPRWERWRRFRSLHLRRHRLQLGSSPMRLRIRGAAQGRRTGAGCFCADGARRARDSTVAGSRTPREQRFGGEADLRASVDRKHRACSSAGCACYYTYTAVAVTLRV